MLEIQQILTTLGALGSSTGENLGIGEQSSNLVLVNPRDTAKTSVFENDTSLAPPLRPCTEYRLLYGSSFLTSTPQPVAV